MNALAEIVQVATPSDTRAAYDECNVVLVPDFCPPMDAEWVHRMRECPPRKDGLDVYKVKLGGAEAELDAEHIDTHCGAGTHAEMVAYTDGVLLDLERWRDTVWPDLEFLPREACPHTFRPSVTGKQGLHADTYSGQPIRAFLNLDTEPRLWNVGPVVGPDDRPEPDTVDTWDRRPVELPPGAMWACNSRRVCHEVVSGRLLLSCSFLYEGMPA